MPDERTKMGGLLYCYTGPVSVEKGPEGDQRKLEPLSSKLSNQGDTKES